jgi:hypothetical protein
MKSDEETSPEFERFSQFVRKVVSVPHSEIKRQLDKEKKQRERQKKKRAKTSPASRASNAPNG